MKIKIGSRTFVATLEDNATAAAFKSLLPMTIKMSAFNGNEKLFRLYNHQAKDRQIGSLAVRIREALSRQGNLAGFGGDGRMER